MADCFHLNSRARETVAGKIKEQIVGWLRGKKRGSDTPVGGDSKRLKLDAASGSGKPGAAAGAGSSRAAGAGPNRAAVAGPTRRGDGMNRAKLGGKGRK
jgi:hypothetical protein